MNQDKHKTAVTFYVEESGSILAYFNETLDSLGFMTSYAHIGQHSACSPEYVKELQQATPEQYHDLEKELTDMGYNLDIRNTAAK